MNRYSNRPFAIAKIMGGEQSTGLSGLIKFYQKRSFVLISVDIRGLPKTESGFYGFHIHTGDTCEGKDFSGTGNHYNPENARHPSHVGDLPPLIYCNGGAFMVVATDRFRVKDVIGRTVVIHNMPDDFNTQPSGNSGTKIGCGEIMKA